MLSDEERRLLNQIAGELNSDDNLVELESRLGSCGGRRDRFRRRGRSGRSPRTSRRRSLVAWAERRFYARIDQRRNR